LPALLANLLGIPPFCMTANFSQDTAIVYTRFFFFFLLLRLLGTTFAEEEERWLCCWNSRTSLLP